MRRILSFVCFAMSFASFLRGDAVARAPTQTTPTNQYVNEGIELDGQIAQAERIVAYLNHECGPEYTTELLHSIGKNAAGSQPSSTIGEGPRELIDLTRDDDATTKKVPYGFWPRYMREELGLRFTDRKKMQLSRSLQMYALKMYQGCQTRAALRGMRSGSSKRSSGAAENRCKAIGLAFALLQYFVDVVQRLQCRTDSNMLMTHARELRERLLRDPAGRWSEWDVPKLIGNAGAQWFLRFREKFGIVKKVIGMKLKVAWRKVKRRVLVLLTNIFRLRAFWDICHEGKQMRWLSVDQKPAWFNNAGHTGTFAKKGGKRA